MNAPLALRFDRQGSGRPVYFLHGFFSDARQWAPLIAAWQKQAAFTAVTPDLPGHGAAAGWRGDWSDLLGQIDAAISAEAEPVTLIGYSMGARILRRLVIQAGPDLQAAILIAPHPGLRPAQARTRRLRDDALAARLLAQPIETSVDQWQNQPIFAGQSQAGPQALERQKLIRLAQSRRGLAYALRQFGSGTCTFGGVRQRDGRVTLIYGDRLAVDGQRAIALKSAWPQAQCLALSGLGHNPILEDPKVLLEHLAPGALGAQR